MYICVSNSASDGSGAIFITLVCHPSPEHRIFTGFKALERERKKQQKSHRSLKNVHKNYKRHAPAHEENPTNPPHHSNHNHLTTQRRNALEQQVVTSWFEQTRCAVLRRNYKLEIRLVLETHLRLRVVTTKRSTLV
jgi:hypothetical protein